MQQQFLLAAGGGQHGWLGMIMPTRVYAMYSKTPWVDPIDPCPNIVSPILASKNECHQAEPQHLEARKNFHQMNIIKTALKNLLCHH